jgi:hypothetical protein
MSAQEKLGTNGNKPAWKKPSVTLTATAKDVRGGAFAGLVEQPPFYTIS